MNRLPFEDEIEVGDVRRCWNDIAPGLMVIKEKSGADWRLEDIYAMCRNGEAYAYLFDGGFAICGRLQNRFTLEIELHFYAVYSSRKDSCMRFLPYFEGLAREIGATSMTMQSHRGIFEQYGWDVEHINYKRRVQ